MRQADAKQAQPASGVDLAGLFAKLIPYLADVFLLIPICSIARKGYTNSYKDKYILFH